MKQTIDRDGVDHLLGALQKLGYETIGPTIRSGAILYDTIRTTKDLPVGWMDTQGAASYRLTRREDDELFGYVVGPMSLKKFLFPPELRLLSLARTNGTMTVTEPVGSQGGHKRAVLGVRACELAALAIQDKIFLDGPYRDPHYEAERRKLFIIAVNCTTTGGNCFCTSTGTGPAATSGYDLCLTELGASSGHALLVETGTEPGEDLLRSLRAKEATGEELAIARARVESAKLHIGKTLEVEGLREALHSGMDDPRWDNVALRCLSCGNCTQVCPTCFCSTVEDVTDLSGREAHRIRKWDSCFTLDFSYIHGGSVRQSVRARYRQWLLHKLDTWIDQFGMMGCVGCGRCITWCPVGIDITEEASALHQQHAVSLRPSGE